MDWPVHVLPFDPLAENSSRRWVQRLLNVSTGNYLGTAAREKKMILELVGRRRPHAILCHFGHIALRLLPVATKAGIPLIAHFHGLDVSSALRNRWYRWSLLRHLNKFAAVIVVGSHQYEWMLEQGVNRSRVHLIPCGVPTQVFTPATQTRDGQTLQLVTVSQLVEHKGVNYSILAFAEVLKHHPFAKLSIVGDGRKRPDLEDLVHQLGIVERVRFLGPLPSDRVLEILRESDIFLQHSLHGSTGTAEGFGVSIAEAAACALPVVVTDCGGIRDQVIGDVTGFVVRQRDVAQMAQAILRLAEEPQLRRSMGSAGRHRVVEMFDTERQVAKLEQVVLSTLPYARP